MLEKLKAISEARGLEEIFDITILETKDDLLEILSLQLLHGEKGDGPMPKYQSKHYATRKQNRGSLAPFGVVDLYFYGDFNDKLKVFLTKKGLRIRSTDKKAPILMSKYGKEIYELNAQNLGIFIDTIFLPAFIKNVRNELL